jgi:LytS/YehU family sensor histidine kinase
LVPFVVTGMWFYVMIAGVSYSAQATARAAQAEAAASRAQLDALRGQLNPHFLFNALHTVIQLIPRQPEQAQAAAEELAAMLRIVVEEDRDVITVAQEMAFVERYLSIERLRFGDRLMLRVNLSEAALAGTLPSFAIQTLVENAIHHGVSPRVDPTTVTITGDMASEVLRLSVGDDGEGPSASMTEARGTGLARLKDRLAVLYGGDSRLEIVSGPASRGFIATLTVRQPADG